MILCYLYDLYSENIFTSIKEGGTQKYIQKKRGKARGFLVYNERKTRTKERERERERDSELIVLTRKGLGGHNVS